MRAALSFAAGWAALVCVGGTAWLAWRAWRKGSREDPWTGTYAGAFEVYTAERATRAGRIAAREAAAKERAAARAERAEQAVLSELEACWNLPATGERAPG